MRIHASEGLIAKGKEKKEYGVCIWGGGGEKRKIRGRTEDRREEGDGCM